MPQAAYFKETNTLWRVARDPDCRFIWTVHIQEQMEARGITAPDILNVLTNGHVTWEEFKADIVWRVEGRDLSGKRLKVAVAVYEDIGKIKIITAF